jgi:protein-tyrosine phosphatase
MINEIIDNIYIGTWNDARNYSNEYIIFTVAWDSPFIGTHFYRLIDGGNEPLPETRKLYFDAVSDLIKLRETDSSKILVHCVSGMSRAPSVVAGYLIYKYNLTPTDAIQYIKNIRPIIHPANAFIQLINEVKGYYVTK